MFSFIGKEEATWGGDKLTSLGCYSRAIFCNDDFVFKVDCVRSHLQMKNQTYYEIELWCELGEDRKYFAQILHHGKTPQGFSWLMQKKYEHIGGGDKDKLRELIDKYRLNDVYPDLEGKGNWMNTTEGIIIYDWGLTKYFYHL